MLAVIAAASLPAHAVVNAQAPTLQSDIELATAGFFSLSWRGAPGADYVLQESTTRSFAEHAVIYQGPDTARVMSGIEDGKYYYRARARGTRSGWSAPVTVTVRHHPLPRAFTFFGAGLIIFVATVTLIIGGARRAEEL